MRKSMAAILWLGLSLGIQTSVFGANWLMLQGTESAKKAKVIKMWGFIQGQGQWAFSKNFKDKYIPGKLIGPNLTAKQQFGINRARLGARGVGFIKDPDVNYFLLIEVGNNGITAATRSPRVTDASVTFNHIPLARIRAGLFKYPGPEEGLQAIHVFDYVNFTTVTNQLMLERFPNEGDIVTNTNPQALGTAPNGFQQPVGAMRDVGAQLFDTITTGSWEHAYAFMVGNGNGLNFGDNNGDKTWYVYWASEMIFKGGKGARRHGLKMFAWHQNGKRAIDTKLGNDENGNSLGFSRQQFKRTRSGLGLKFLNHSFRVSGEYMLGKGMIFLGPHKETFDVNGIFNDGKGDGHNGKAAGWYIDAGWRMFSTPFELDIRYDTYTRLIDDPFEVKFNTTTLGVQWFLNKKSRITINYELRSGKSDHPPINNNLKDLGNRASLSWIAIF